jgi:serine phosphatase RsbU (regulator of sigma subunit)
MFGPGSRRHPFRTGYLVVLGALALGALVVGLAARGSEAAVLLLVFTCLAVLPVAFWSVRWLWRKLTYRVGVRFFLSYLLIGLTPFFLMAILAAIAGYILVGQYASVRLGQELDALGERLTGRVASVVQGLRGTGPQPAATLLGSPIAAGGPRFSWVLAQGTRVWHPEGGEELAVPEWAPEGGWRGTVVVGKTLEVAAIERRGDVIAAMLVPLDVANAPKVSKAQWFQARFVTSEALAKVGEQKKGTVTVSQGPTERGSALRIGGEKVPPDQVEPGWLNAEGNVVAGVEPHPSGVPGDRWHRMRLAWVRVLEAPRNWHDGSSAGGMLAVAIMKVSVGGAADDLFAGPKKMGSEIRSALAVSALVFGVMYLIAVSFAAVMILSVARATARLTRGARAVARGDFDHRIPVKRRDQLGDLAVSFNTMTESVRTMVTHVAEKERMAREMELAREIQSSLLPPSELSSGALSVWAHFRPAAEVGGDYFDLFPLAPGRLVVSIGDVAGHGLPTGLLMAMVKSAAAALIGEGYRGGELLSRLNHLLLGQSLKQRMVSFALAEVDAEQGEVKIASAGHQPGVLLAADGGVEEVLLSSLPLGHRWPDPAPERKLPFAPGSRLLLYSDGLVEAHDAAGNPFGYERLQEVLLRHREVGGPQVLAALLAELDHHVGGHPLGDDLTVVLVEHRPALG